MYKVPQGGGVDVYTCRYSMFLQGRGVPTRRCGVHHISYSGGGHSAKAVSGGSCGRHSRLERTQVSYNYVV